MNSVIQTIQHKINQVKRTDQLLDLLYVTLVDFNVPDEGVSHDLVIGSTMCKKKKAFIEIFYKDEPYTITSSKGVDLTWLQPILKQSGFLKRLRFLEQKECDITFDQERQKLVEWIENDIVIQPFSSPEPFYETLDQLLSESEKVYFKKNKIWIWSLVIDFCLMNHSYPLDFNVLDVIDEYGLDEFRPFFDGSKPNLYTLSDKELIQYLYSHDDLNELEMKIIESKLKPIPPDLLLDLGQEEPLVQKDTFYLEDEIDNAIHPRPEFNSDLDPDDPEYLSQYQNYILENDVVTDERYIPLDGEKERNQKKLFQEELLSHIVSSKQKLIPSDLKKMILNLDCNNPINPITLEQITKKNYLELGWIIVLDESGTNGDCYDKKEYIESLLENVTFAPFPYRQEKFYKEPLKGVWIDKRGLGLIPTSKIVQLRPIGKKVVGTRLGISRTHGSLEPVYTLDELY